MTQIYRCEDIYLIQNDEMWRWTVRYFSKVLWAVYVRLKICTVNYQYTIFRGNKLPRLLLGNLWRFWIKSWRHVFPYRKTKVSQSHCPRGLRRRSTAARLLRLWFRIPPGAWRSVCCECCALSGRGLYDELITRPEKSYQLWCVVVCDLETSWMRRPWPTGGAVASKTNKKPGLRFK
jgi:hypothetical protein